MKLSIANHIIHSTGVIKESKGSKISFRNRYDSIFLENKFVENKDSIFKRLKVIYRYSQIIALRGVIQGAVVLGTYNTMLESENYTNREEKLAKVITMKTYITSTNPVLAKLISTGYFDRTNVENKESYRKILKSSIISGLLVSLTMTHFDLAFHYIVKEALENKEKKINFFDKLKAFRARKIYGKNIRYLLVSSSTMTSLGVQHVAILNISEFDELHGSLSI